MRTGISVSVLAADRRRLQAIVADPKSRQKHVWRARIVLLTADGIGTSGIMTATGKSKTCVWRWQERFMEAGVDGLLSDRTRPAGKAPIAQDRVAEVVRLTLAPPPAEATHWTVRAMARAVGMAVSTVQDIWKEHGLAPHRWRSFKLSNDPAFVEKLHAIVGLYVSPPAHAVVLSIDEKSQIQALDRTQPGLPMKKGRGATMTHDYKRNGTTTLFAALNVLEGTVTGQNMQRHRHQEFIVRCAHPQRAGARHPGRQTRPRDHGQLRRPQDTRGPPLARASSTLDLPLHADVEFVAECSRGLLRQTHPKTSQARRVPLGHRPPGRHQPLRRRAQQVPKAIHLESRSRRHHRRTKPRVPSVGVNPLAGAIRGRQFDGRRVVDFLGRSLTLIDLT